MGDDKGVYMHVENTCEQPIQFEGDPGSRLEPGERTSLERHCHSADCRLEVPFRLLGGVTSTETGAIHVRITWTLPDFKGFGTFDRSRLFRLRRFEPPSPRARE